MAISEAKKKSNAKWDAANMTSIAVRVRKDFAAHFAEAAKAEGTTRNAVLLKAAKDFVERHENGKQADN